MMMLFYVKIFRWMAAKIREEQVMIMLCIVMIILWISHRAALLVNLKCTKFLGKTTPISKIGRFSALRLRVPRVTEAPDSREPNHSPSNP